MILLNIICTLSIGFISIFLYICVYSKIIDEKRKNIRWIKKEIEDAFIEAQYHNHQILFRGPDCTPYRLGGIHIANQNDKPVITLDLYEYFR